MFGRARTAGRAALVAALAALAIPATAQAAPTVVDLAVNNASERGLLGIALAPNFPLDPGVYLYWTCRSSVAPDTDPTMPEERECNEAAMLGPDSGVTQEVP